MIKITKRIKRKIVASKSHIENALLEIDSNDKQHLDVTSTFDFVEQEIYNAFRELYHVNESLKKTRKRHEEKT